ncbi:phosphatase PAP2 family protein, partial [Streptomyces goshikiensis]|uniref:phosphatase PAP2 family protein n=1 Tax=Streptomyces goshikiensis TaxID=1942 RepID=UPI0036C9B8AD
SVWWLALFPALIARLMGVTARRGRRAPGAPGYYPSGHTATAAVAYLGAALLVRPYVRRPWPLPVALALTAATACGLILRGFHWPLDVLASCFLCVPLLLAVRRATGRGPGREPGRPPE